MCQVDECRNYSIKVVVEIVKSSMKLVCSQSVKSLRGSERESECSQSRVAKFLCFKIP